MRKNDIARQFIAAVNRYVAMQNEKMKRYGLTELIPEVDELPDEDKDLLTRFSRHAFPALTPHRHLYFFDEFKQNAKYIAFGGNDNYNDVYVVDKKRGRYWFFQKRKCSNMLVRIILPLFCRLSSY